MKILDKDFRALRLGCYKALSNNNLRPFQVQNIRSAWDVFSHANTTGLIDAGHLYSYLNDANIETALKRIFKHV